MFFLCAADFNNKLKKLRKENPVIPVDQLTDVILGQFRGEQGERFQVACAKFCENQGQAMKLLQVKLKNSDKFNSFITVRVFCFVTILNSLKHFL